MYRYGIRSLQLGLQQFRLSERGYAKNVSKSKTEQVAAAAASATAKLKKIEANEVKENSISARFLERSLGGSYRRWSALLEKYAEVRIAKRKELIKTIEILKSLNYDANDVFTKPLVLTANSLTLANRHRVLVECGFSNISLAVLFKYISVINKPPTLLKTYGYIPKDLDVIEQLRSTVSDLELRLPADVPLNEQMHLKLIREHVITAYMRQRLDMTDSDLDRLWRVYGRVRHKSLYSMQSIIALLEELSFSKERIRKNAYLLHADADNMRRIVNEVKTIADQDIREIVYRRPKIMMSNCDSLLKTLEYVRAFGIGEEAVLRCLEILTLGSDTVLERLRDLNEIEEFQVLATNPRVLRLVHYQNKARLRLEYLNQLKVRCASLHILSCGSEAFAKFARDGSDRTKGCDVVVYLAHTMQKDEQHLRSMLSRHPNWCHIPVVHVKQCYEFLISKKFKTENIYRNLHLLLYPITRIEEKLLELQSIEFLKQLQLEIGSVHQLSNDEQLTLILYLIECDFHFTGDGIWTEQHAHQVENFHNLLPDFPESLNKIYKYGVKPAEKTSSLAL